MHSSCERGAEGLLEIYGFLDMIPLGRQEKGVVRRFFIMISMMMMLDTQPASALMPSRLRRQK
jgi:predicted dithiol-disulfide oxidoreductase (DUF899 family)